MDREMVLRGLWDDDMGVWVSGLNELIMDGWEKR